MNWMARVREAVKDKRVLALLLLLTAFFIFKAFYSTAFPITGDEAYHWEWSRNPAFGYYDHPPLIGWIIALSTLIGGFIGGSELFWTRLPALLSATAVLIMVYLLLVQSTGKRTPGLYGVVFLMAAPLFSIGANVVTTDQPLIFFSGLTVYLLYQAIFREKEHYWYYAGISLGLAFLSKFISILILPGVLLFLIISAEDRYWFKKKEPYIFALIAALLYLPNLLWNAGHNWITFLFNFNRQVGSTSSLEGLGLYIVGQLGVIGLLLFPCLLIALIKGVRRGVRKKDRNALFFSLIALSIFVFFALISLSGQAGAHWTAIAFLPGVVCFFYVYRELFAGIKLKKTIWWVLHAGLLLSLIITVGLHLLLVYNYLLPEEISPAGQQVEIDHSTFGFFYGWDELGEYLNQLQVEHDEELFLITPHYAIAGMVSFNTPGQPFVRLFGQKYITGLNYKYWNNYDELIAEDALYIINDPADRNRDILESSFQSIEELQPLKIYNPEGLHVRTFYLFYCEDFNGSDHTTSNTRVSSWFE